VTEQAGFDPVQPSTDGSGRHCMVRSTDTQAGRRVSYRSLSPRHEGAQKIPRARNSSRQALHGAFSLASSVRDRNSEGTDWLMLRYILNPKFESLGGLGNLKPRFKGGSREGRVEGTSISLRAYHASLFCEATSSVLTRRK
jgi:hypothetical protein